MCTLSTIRVSAFGLLAATLLTTGIAFAKEQNWMMAAFDGRCVPMESFDNIGAATHTPDEFVSYLRAEGQKVSVSEVPAERGRAVLVEVGPRRQPFVFVTADNCGGKEPLKDPSK